MRSRFILFPLLSAVLSACGYHVGGKGDMVPKSIQTIAIPPFSTNSTQYRLPDILANQLGREFTERTRFTVVNNPSVADAVLSGTLANVSGYPVISDPSSGKATSIQLTATISVKLVQRATGRVLYSRPNFNIKTYYQIANDPHQYFDETGPAFTRLSQTAAQDIVSGVMESF